MTSIIIFGGGFIARSLIESLPSQTTITVVSRFGNDLASLRPDISVYRDIQHLAGRGTFDLAVYCSGPSLPRSVTKTVSDKARSDLRVALDASQRSKVFIYMSSGGAIYKPSDDAMTEKHPLDYHNSYSALHRLNELEVQRAEKISTRICFRLGNPFGRHQDPTRSVGFVSQCIQCAVVGSTLDIVGDGSTSRDFFHVRSIGRAVTAASRIGAVGFAVYNLGSGESSTLNQVVQYVESETGVVLQRRYISSLYIDRPIVKLDVSKFRRDFSNVDIVGAELGIRTF